MTTNGPSDSSEEDRDITHVGAHIGQPRECACLHVTPAPDGGISHQGACVVVHRTVKRQLPTGIG